MARFNYLKSFGFAVVILFLLNTTSFPSEDNKFVSRECRVFLVPGAFAPHGLVARFLFAPEDYFAQATKYFRAKKCQVKIAFLPTDGSIEERALVIRDQIDSWVPVGQKTIILAHSQGGLDARFALKTVSGSLKSKVSGLATLGVPHFGTPLSNAVVWQNKNHGWVAWFFRVILGYDFTLLRFAPEMSPEFLSEKKEYFRAVNEVAYASGVARCKTKCFYGFSVLSYWVNVGPGDGVIPSESQKFGYDLGEFDLDHISEIDLSPSKASERERFLNSVWSWIKKIEMERI